MRILLLALLIAMISCRPQQSAKDKALRDTIQKQLGRRNDTDSLRISDSIYSRALTSPNGNLRDLLKDFSINKPNFLSLLKKCRTEKDEFEGTKFVYDRSSPKYVNVNGTFLYINEAGPALRLTFRYEADDWLFIRSMIFNADGKTFEYTPLNGFKRDNGGGRIWEWSDELMETGDVPMLNAISSAKNVRVKLIGDHYYKIVTVTNKQKAAFKNMLLLYKGFLLGYNK